MTERDMVSFAIDIAVHPNAIVLPFIALPTLLQHLDIVSDCHGFLNPCGLRVGSTGVGVRVGICKPSKNPYPLHGLRVLAGFWAGFP